MIKGEIVMKSFNYFQPTEIVYGTGRLSELGEIAKRFGKRCLLVTTPPFPAVEAQYAKIKSILKDAGIELMHFDQVQPNPTTDVITAGAEMAQKHKADMVIGLGGGSSMDSAKAIAVEATHEGSAWEYLYYKTQPTEKTLPIIAISTTSGTGSQVTQVAVITNTKERDKSAIFNPIIYPKVCLVDPELMLTVPGHITASTGFDALCHAFESTLHPNASVYVETLAWKAIELVVNNLPDLLNDLGDLEARSSLAVADTFAGLCIANAGVTLPHGIGMAIGGMYPKVMHGETLAINYPAFSRYTWSYAIPQFAKVGQILNPDLKNETEEKAAGQSCEEIDKFLKKIGMWLSLEQFDVPESELPELAKQSMVLPDYEGNPRVVTLEEMEDIVRQCYRR
jgi:alcohol dehydrogenase class IV